MPLIDFLMRLIAILLFIPVLVLFTQVLSAFFIKRDSAKLDFTSAQEPSFAVLIPAHNESTGILDTLLSIIPQLKNTDQLLVVADNCSDNTAEIVRQHDVDVVERHDATRRGKGYALDFGIAYLASKPCDVLIIVDADCIVEPQSLKKLAIDSLQHHRPVQALYLMQNKTDVGLKAKIAEFAWHVKNWVRPLGFLKLGLPCQLMGTGMAFPWDSIVKIDLASGHIVEDMKLGVDFALANQPPLFCPEAKVTSFFPITSEVQKGQSKRWEHGHLAMILSELPRLMRKSLGQANFSMSAMALDLSVPPLALLVGLLVTYTLMTGFFDYFFGLAHLAFGINLWSILMLTVAVFLAWLGWGRAIVSFSNLMYIPIYILLKIPNYFSFIFKRQSTWNKTKREHK